MSLDHPVWETYKRHLNAAGRDRPKHYPGGTLVRNWTDTSVWQVKEQRLKSMMPKDCPDTASYAAWFVKLNNLT